MEPLGGVSVHEKLLIVAIYKVYREIHCFSLLSGSKVTFTRDMGLSPILYSVAQDTTPKTSSGSCALPLEKSLSLRLDEYGVF